MMTVSSGEQALIHSVSLEVVRQVSLMKKIELQLTLMKQ
jgi:hypothetical protein